MPGVTGLLSNTMTGSLSWSLKPILTGVSYALGNLPKVRRLITGKDVVISNPLRNVAQALYELHRSLLMNCNSQ
jgi:hypothetical protein